MNKKLLVIISSIIAAILVAVASWFIIIANKKYEVIFDSDGGSIVEAQEVKNKNQAIKPTNPTKAKYDFIGWYLDDEEFDFTTPITEDITLIAKWVLKDLVMECNIEKEEGGASMIGQLLVKFDPVTHKVKDADGSVEVTFQDKAMLEKMKPQIRANLCPKTLDQPKCVETTNGNVLKLEVKNEKNIVDVNKDMEGVKKDLEKGVGFICKLKED